jgi:hypothetical protein
VDILIYGTANVQLTSRYVNLIVRIRLKQLWTHRLAAGIAVIGRVEMRSGCLSSEHGPLQLAQRSDGTAREDAEFRFCATECAFEVIGYAVSRI